MLLWLPSFYFSCYNISPFYQAFLFSEETEVHLQHCSPPCSFWFSPDVFMLSQLVAMSVYCPCLAFSFPLPQMHAAFMACIFTETYSKDLLPCSDLPPCYCFRTRRGKEPQMAGIGGGPERKAAPNSFYKTNLLLVMTCLLKFYTNKAM